MPEAPAVELVEVGPRDGLQAEPQILSTADKVELGRRLHAAGLRRIETASFVHPGLVPQMADAEAVANELASPGIIQIGLVLNRRGLERALATPVQEINFVVPASDGYAAHNQNSTVEATMGDVEMMIPTAVAAGRTASVTISVAFGDPFDGRVQPGRVVELAARSTAAGAGEIALGDTIGAAVPPAVEDLIGAVRDQLGSDTRLRCHFHNTRNTGYANVVAATGAGVDALDTAVGGYGGSPFAPNAGGNVATEDVAHLLQRMGVTTGVDVAAVVATAQWLQPRLGTPLRSMIPHAGTFPG